MSQAGIATAVNWPALNLRFVETAASAMAYATGLPRGVCTWLVILALGFAAFQVGRGLVGIVKNAGRH